MQTEMYRKKKKPYGFDTYDTSSAAAGKNKMPENIEVCIKTVVFDTFREKCSTEI